MEILLTELLLVVIQLMTKSQANLKLSQKIE